MKNIFRFSWVEMSGGFDQQCNILVDSKEEAIKTFMIKVWWRNQLKILDPIEEFDKLKYVYVENLNSKYTKEYLENMEIKIHYEI